MTTFTPSIYVTVGSLRCIVCRPGHLTRTEDLIFGPCLRCTWCHTRYPPDWTGWTQHDERRAT